MRRDDELKRLVHYAKAMNVQVSFKPAPKKADCSAFWTTDGKEIVVYTYPNQSKTFLILCLLHEIGHVCEFIHGNNRQIDGKLDEALDSEEKKSHRKRVYDWEVKSAIWWETIYKEADLKFPVYKINIERDQDLWMYKVYYETGEFPTKKDKKEKRRELKRKYKP